MNPSSTGPTSSQAASSSSRMGDWKTPILMKAHSNGRLNDEKVTKAKTVDAFPLPTATTASTAAAAAGGASLARAPPPLTGIWAIKFAADAKARVAAANAAAAERAATAKAKAMMDAEAAVAKAAALPTSSARRRQRKERQPPIHSAVATINSDDNIEEYSFEYPLASSTFTSHSRGNRNRNTI
jgi:hypothetical protein